ncbi:uracil-DNA glycosylase [Sulfidibacter corallicola]|uniref:Uracil-DNA glycosylase n=1 Tax=Sulfidibacter corallicola TaxID=2818388 RepID=A0A8A4TWQ9_SULCO|nr:uracil-DNA glycosylase [Sulfidibacter corallicola]
MEDRAVPTRRPSVSGRDGDDPEKTLGQAGCTGAQSLVRFAVLRKTPSWSKDLTEEETKRPQLEESWLEALGDEFQKPYMAQLKAFLVEEKKRYRVYPPGPLMFNALNTTPFHEVKVVLLGQDPYHGPNQAHGLCFSVNRGIPVPPSLRNMYAELEQSLGIPPAAHGDLSHWAKQGVLMLNTTLSVRAGQAKSHAGRGWETFTDRIIDVLNENREGLVFVLWGRHAGSKAGRIDSDKHLILGAPHPSPLSAHSGFFGCGHFAAINHHLERRGDTPIDWQLPA